MEPFTLNPAGAFFAWSALVLALSLALVLARQHRFARRQTQVATSALQNLSNFHRALLTELQLTRILQQVTRSITRLGYGRATLYLRDPATGMLLGQAGAVGENTLTQSSLANPAGPSRAYAGLFAPPDGLMLDGVVLLPVVGPPEAGGTPWCWLAPETKCLLRPRVTLADREERCPSCKHFGLMGVLEAEPRAGQPRLPVDGGLVEYAQSIALAVERARLYERVREEGLRSRRRLDQLELIFEVGRDVASTLAVDEVLERLARGLNGRLGFARVSVALAHEGLLTGHMTLIGQELRWTRGISRIEFDIATHPDPFAQVSRSGIPLVIRDASADERLPGRVRSTVHTVGYVPIKAPLEATPEGLPGRPVTLGVLAVDYGREDRAIETSDLEVLSTLCSQVGIAIRNARAFEALEASAREARARSALNEALAAPQPRAGLGEVAVDALAASSPDALAASSPGARAWLDAICDAVAAYAQSDFALFCRLDEAPGSLEAATATAGSSRRGREATHALGPRRGASLTLEAVQRNTPIIVPDVNRDARAAEEAAIYGRTALLVQPLGSGRRAPGALILGRVWPSDLDQVAPPTWTEHDLRRLAAVAQELALALENAELTRALDVERLRLAGALENLGDGVLTLDGDTVRANAAARSVLRLPEVSPRQGLPAQLLALTQDAPPQRTDATTRQGANLARRRAAGARGGLDPEPSLTTAPAGLNAGTLTLGEARFQVLVTRRAGLTLVVLQDLARFRAVEQAKAEFLSVVSHELRTPLTAIIGFTDLLLTGAAGPLSEDQVDFLRTTLDASHRLHQTVLNLLDASRLEAGQFDVNLKPSRPDFAAVIASFQGAANEKGVTLDAPLQPLPLLNVDAPRLEQVLANLLSNALRYSPFGANVRVECAVEPGGAGWRFDVVDGGPGMDPERLAGLFRRFTRGQGSHEALEGAGLALYVSRAIIVAHGGRIWARSAPGEGTTMHVSLPIQAPLPIDAPAIES